MGNLQSLKNAKRLSYGLSVVFLLAHVVMYIIFYKYEVTPLVYINAVSACYYLVMMYLIYKERLFEYTVAAFVEISLHMGLDIYYLGWNGGFQVNLIGICILLTFAEYVGRTLKIRYVHSVYLMPLAMIIYLGTYIFNMYHTPEYTIPDGVYSFFQIAWALTNFLIMFFILQLFVFVTTKAQEVLSDEVMHDELTGLPNRFYIRSYFDKLLALPSMEGYWIAITDLDDFKAVNDTYGHNCGDYVLKTLAEELGKLSEGIEVCRWGGEEFLIVGHSDISDPLEELEKLRKSIESYPFRYRNTKLHMTMTIGIARYEKGSPIRTWISAADKKLYEGKQAGKNRVVS